MNKHMLDKLACILPPDVIGKYHYVKKSKLLYLSNSIHDFKISITDGIAFSGKNNGTNIFYTTNNSDFSYLYKNLAVLFNISDLSSNFTEDTINESIYSYIQDNQIDREYLQKQIDVIYSMMNKSFIENIKVSYRELLDHRIIVSSKSGVSEVRLLKPQIRVKFFLKNKDFIDIGKGITGDITDLFKQFDIERELSEAYKLYTLETDNSFKSGEYDILMSPAIVGYICHEAVGHLVEGDNLIKGSCLLPYYKKRIAPEFVSIVDNGNSKNLMGSGDIIIDDEGTESNITYIIKDGVLNSFICNNELSTKLNIEATGNHRAPSFNFIPNIRMTNTYMLPQDNCYDQMISSINYGVYLKDGVIEGNTNLDGTFTITMKRAYIIKNGRLIKKINNVKLHDNVISFLSNIFMVGNDLHLALGTTSCGKGQSIKVDGGGPHIVARSYLEV